MASQSLYRKWRSQSFSELIGQEAVVRTLLNAVRDGRLAHAYLFCGPRGTGKTSTARLLAKAVNCANPHDGEPCNECISCREISAGHSPDVIEIDAASNTQAEDARKLVGTVGLMSTSRRYKVYVIDEVHMLSTHAFNALLKTLEEPPPHVIFVLATTEAHKVLPTIVSRCQRFDFRRHSVRNIVGHLRHVAEGEGLELEPAAAELIARAAQGGMRDALSLLDQAVAFNGTHLDLDSIRSMLGLADPGTVRALIVDVAEQRSADGLHRINELVINGADLRQLNTQLSEEWRALVLACAGADVAELMDRTDEDAREISALASRFSLEELTACARVFARNETPARGLPVPQLALELSFLECVAIRANGGLPVAAAQPTPQHQPAAGSRPPAPSLSAALPAMPPARPHQSQAQTAAPRSPSPERPPIEELDLLAIEREDASPAPNIWAGGPDAPASPATHAPEPAPVPLADPLDIPTDEEWPDASESASAAPAPGDLHETLFRAQSEWALVKQVCKQKSMSVAALLNSARPVLVEPGERPVLVLQADHKFHLEKLREPKSKAAIEWALEQVVGAPVLIRIVPASGNSGGPSSGGNPGNAPGGPASNRGSLPGGGMDSSRGSSSGARARPPTPLNAAPASPFAATNNVNGRSAQPMPPTQVRDAGESYVPNNVTPLRPPIRPDVRPSHSLEDEVRADPVIQALIRTHGIELADVRPLNADKDDVL
ncbi:MAG: DNA polymerase III subunits gamma and tau [Ktedonobacterales bacterium]|jgi:DNA polymerase-3 subunit gamma/tau|nr:MAG: DNA polymerase III subunits gamma and tau [Ktedonobacterales bacterium]